MAAIEPAVIEPSVSTTPIHLTRLRPLDMGRMLDQAIRLYRRNFTRFLLIAALVQLPSAAVMLLSTSGAFVAAFAVDPAAMDLGRVFGMSGIFFVMSILTAAWAQFGACVLTQSASDAYLGAASPLRSVVRRAGRAWLAVLAAYLLAFVALIPLSIMFIIPIIGWLAAIPGTGMIAYFMAVILPLMVPVIVIEKRTGRQGIGRAWHLARARFWWMFGFFSILWLFSMLVVQGPLYLVTSVLSLVGDATLSPGMLTVLATLISFLLGVIYYPISVTSAMLVYYDTRVRREGLDLALRTLPADTDGWADIDTLLRTPPATSQRLRPTWGEVGAFSLIAMVAGVLFIVFALIMSVTMLPLLEAGF
ncbi:MAG: hypothetical protein KDD83_10595 [Caldilineaceae bacterium]|nr:hypothetical protein [Caldilineaceae bacterium]